MVFALKVALFLNSLSFFPFCILNAGYSEEKTSNMFQVLMHLYRSDLTVFDLPSFTAFWERFGLVLFKNCETSEYRGFDFFRLTTVYDFVDILGYVAFESLDWVTFFETIISCF